MNSRAKPWPAEAYAEFMGITPEAAAQQRYRKQGPPYIKANGRIYYLPEDVCDWLEQNKVR